MVDGHVVEGKDHFWHLFDVVLDHVLSCFGVSFAFEVSFSWLDVILYFFFLEFGVPAADESPEIHEVFSEGTGLVETNEIHHTSSHHLIRRNTEDLLIFQLLQREDDTECHGDGQARRHSNGDEIQELDHKIACLH